MQCSDRTFSFMRSATNHLVVTFDDSFVFGGHFYMFETLSETLQAMAYEHYLGTSITNTEHCLAPVLLMKACCAVAEFLALPNQKGMIV